MQVANTFRGYARTTVQISKIAEDRPVSDDLLAGYAMASAGENPSSLFGWRVTQQPEDGTATVVLHTD